MSAIRTSFKMPQRPEVLRVARCLPVVVNNSRSPTLAVHTLNR